MPELPDVAVFGRNIEDTSLDQRIERVEVKDAGILKGVSAKKFKSALEGHRFTSTRRHGKYLFVETDGPQWLVLHFGMTGRPIYYQDPEDAPRFERVVFHFRNGCKLAYDCMRKIGHVCLTDDPDRFISEHELGPDALDQLTRFERFRELIGGRSGTIKSALMTQETMAGVGNEYSDEILFQAGVHPKRKAKDLDEKTLRAVFEAMRKVLPKAIERKCVPEKFPRTYLLRYRDSEGVCPRCKTALTKLTVSGRTAYVCENCQK